MPPAANAEFHGHHFPVRRNVLESSKPLAISSMRLQSAVRASAFGTQRTGYYQTASRSMDHALPSRRGTESSVP